ncbi:MAG: bifunctional UDP-N-acetylglucosamine diphosphorylase/glucosamine-1-phosphate N-acetyltransferase GlmU [Candidatus Nanopelagicales bacterium]
MATVVVVLAAGAGTRMRTNLAKVLHPIAGQPILHHVINCANSISPDHLVVVVGHQRAAVLEFLSDKFPHAIAAVQEEQNGTGDATAVALAALSKTGVKLQPTDKVVVLAGDIPLIQPHTLQPLADLSHDAVVLTSIFADPTGYGRVIRAGELVTAIVEEKDATDEQREILEINSGIYAIKHEHLVAHLANLSTDNAASEKYLTDVIKAIADGGGKVLAALVDADDVMGVNDKEQLAQANGLLSDRITQYWLQQGVTMIDPSSTWIDVTVQLSPDVVLYPNVYLEGSTNVASGATIGPDSVLRDCIVGEGATVVSSRCIEATIAAGANVGPYSFLRPETHLAENAKVGAFVEVKKSRIGRGSKVPHLTYVGDAEIGEGSNIGASTVFVNYDGENKHKTVVGDQVRIGSDSMLVAPVEIGDGAYTAAGSVITENVPPGAMAVARSRQRNIFGWVLRKRAGSKSAAAAEKHPESDIFPPSTNSEEA